MPAVAIKMDQSSLVKDILLPIAMLVAGWLASSFLKVSKSDFKELMLRTELIEKGLADRITRAEFRQELAEIRAEFKDGMTLLRSDSKTAFEEIKTEIRALRSR